MGRKITGCCTEQNRTASLLMTCRCWQNKDMPTDRPTDLSLQTILQCHCMAVRWTVHHRTKADLERCKNVRFASSEMLHWLDGLLHHDDVIAGAPETATDGHQATGSTFRNILTVLVYAATECWRIGVRRKLVGVVHVVGDSLWSNSCICTAGTSAYTVISACSSVSHCS